MDEQKQQQPIQPVQPAQPPQEAQPAAQVAQPPVPAMSAPAQLTPTVVGALAAGVYYVKLRNVATQPKEPVVQAQPQPPANPVLDIEHSLFDIEKDMVDLDTDADFEINLELDSNP
ncbi:MAG: hypothetical protein UX44_C0004G0004 [candidate division WWE3 bacterium GW2011_GWA1_46_21]|uniref:Uncharacterized protein n=1 Tax=candidate division WWE3 bacterium GW2011_GWA1_46_21 TaxID=1619107 RepID=A0A0G1SEC4_UNCKA|nr:MAG: hypothetical protein UX44_C0004G0004 [candidate division WWE3 bacterium GW2011_GWA1_46_21]